VAPPPVFDSRNFMAQFCMQDRLSYAGNLYCSLANVFAV